MSACSQAEHLCLDPADDWFDEATYGELAPAGADDAFSAWERDLIARDLERFLAEHK